MDHATLAERFNQTAEELGRSGHGVIVRRARSLISEGEVAAGVAFLRDASRRQSLPTLDQLAAAVEAWQGAGGSAADLTRTPAWSQGTTRGEQVSQRIAKVTANSGLDALITTLALEQAELAADEQPAQVDAPALDRLTGPQVIANIWGQVEKPSAVVEADSQLVPVEIDLDDEPRAAPRRMVNDPTSAPPMPEIAPATAPPRRAVETASVPLAPEELDQPTQVTAPPFPEEELDVVELGDAVQPLVAPETPAAKPTQVALPPPPPPPPEVIPPSEVEPGGNTMAWVFAFILLAALVAVLVYSR